MIELVPAKIDQREVFNIWQTRFVKEYNRSQQHRQGHELIAGISPDRWAGVFKHNTPPLFIKVGKNVIGFVSPNIFTTINPRTGQEQQMRYVCDVYVDRRARSKGVLVWVLKTMRDQGIEVIAIDRKKIEEHAGYYWALGFRWAVWWHEQELLLVSPRQHSPEWFRILPDQLDEQQ